MEVSPPHPRPEAAGVRLRLKCDDTRAETRFRLSAKRTSPFKSAGASVQSNAGSRSVRISVSSAGYTMFRGSVKGTGYPLHSPVSLSLPLPCVTVCHHVSTGLYNPSAFALLRVPPGALVTSRFTRIWSVPLFADHITALTASFDSTLAAVGNPVVGQLGRYLC
jgi:hypothetical protein